MDFDAALAAYLAGRPDIERPAREASIRAHEAAIRIALAEASGQITADALPVVTIGGRILFLHPKNLPVTWPLLLREPGKLAPAILSREKTFAILGIPDSPAPTR